MNQICIISIYIFLKKSNILFYIRKLSLVTERDTDCNCKRKQRLLWINFVNFKTQEGAPLLLF